jgi:hypothetical protein
MARAGERRAVPDPAVFAPSGETWTSVRALYEAGALAKVSVARLAGVSADTLRERAKREAWSGAPGVRTASVVSPPALPTAALPGSPGRDPARGTGPGQALPQWAGGGLQSVPGVAPPPALPTAALPGSLRDPTLPQGEGGGAPLGSLGGAEGPAAAVTPEASTPDPRTQSGRAALVDQLYGLFAAQLAAAGSDGLGGALEQRMRSLATFAKTLDALVDLDQRLGARAETGEADFDGYRAELARCLDALVGGRGEGG